MTFLIKQRVFSFRDRFDIMDEYGTPVYSVEGEFFSLGKQLHIYDHNQIEVISLWQKLFHFMPRFVIEINGREAGILIRKFTFLTQRYFLQGPDWTITGDFFAHDYEITDSANQSIATVEKQWFSFGDCYVIDVKKPEDSLLAIAVVLGIDCTMATQN